MPLQCLVGSQQSDRVCQMSSQANQLHVKPGYVGDRLVPMLQYMSLRLPNTG